MAPWRVKLVQNLNIDRFTETDELLFFRNTNWWIIVAWKKSGLHPPTIAKVWFLTFNYETGQHRPSNFRNRANLALGVVLKVVFNLKLLQKSDSPRNYQCVIRKWRKWWLQHQQFDSPRNVNEQPLFGFMVYYTNYHWWNTAWNSNNISTSGRWTGDCYSCIQLLGYLFSITVVTLLLLTVMNM